MDFYLFGNILIVVMLILAAASMVVAWGACIEIYRDGGYVVGTVLLILALFVTFLGMSLFGAVFGWDFPVNWPFEPYPW